MVLMYRPNVGTDWTIDTGTVLNTGTSATDKVGSFTINHLKKGEYAFAIYQSDKVDSAITTPPSDSCFVAYATSVKNISPNSDNFIVYPNPSHNNFVVDGILYRQTAKMQLYNLNGQLIYYHSLVSGQVHEQVNTTQL